MSQTSLRDFVILKRLGRGSYGEVFLVQRLLDKNNYCLKQIHIAHLSQFFNHIASFLSCNSLHMSLHRDEKRQAVRECYLLAELDSPFIVRYYESFIEDDALNIVMEYAPNGTLSEYIQRQVDSNTPIPEQTIWKFIIELILGVQRIFSFIIFYLLSLLDIHNKHIIHRDIKSLNVFLGDNDVYVTLFCFISLSQKHFFSSIKIGDFGVARALSSSSSFATTMVGSPLYLSPELVKGEKYNSETDVWALGCVCYELCCLRKPFEAANQAALIMTILNHTPDFKVRIADGSHAGFSITRISLPCNFLFYSSFFVFGC